MTKSTKTARNIAAEMFDHYLERGLNTREGLRHAGYSDEEIDANWQEVAARILAAETSTKAA